MAWSIGIFPQVICETFDRPCSERQCPFELSTVWLCGWRQLRPRRKQRRMPYCLRSRNSLQGSHNFLQVADSAPRRMLNQSCCANCTQLLLHQFSMNAPSQMPASWLLRNAPPLAAGALDGTVWLWQRWPRKSFRVMVSCSCRRCAAWRHDAHCLRMLQSELDVRLNWAGGAQQVPPVRCGLSLPNGALRHGHGLQLSSQFYCMQGKRHTSATRLCCGVKVARAKHGEVALTCMHQPAAMRMLSACRQTCIRSPF